MNFKIPVIETRTRRCRTSKRYRSSEMHKIGAGELCAFFVSRGMTLGKEFYCSRVLGSRLRDPSKRFAYYRAPDWKKQHRSDV